jgi:hypothetical protein
MAKEPRRCKKEIGISSFFLKMKIKFLNRKCIGVDKPVK